MVGQMLGRLLGGRGLFRGLVGLFDSHSAREILEMKRERKEGDE